MNTPKELYRYTRLPFGISSAPAIFQRVMKTLLQGIPNVSVHIDDILVMGKSHKEHLCNLQEVLFRLEQAELRLKQSKCAFFYILPSTDYLGHQISAEGIQPTKEKVRATMEPPASQNVSQLRSFLGRLNYYAKFLPQLSAKLAPLYSLLQKKKKWVWGVPQKRAFQEAKESLMSNRILTHHNPQQELILSCDASLYGLEAVLSHCMDDGTEKPIAFASRSLAPAEWRYAQLDKEALAIDHIRKCTVEIDPPEEVSATDLDLPDIYVPDTNISSDEQPAGEYQPSIRQSTRVRHPPNGLMSSTKVGGM